MKKILIFLFAASLFLLGCGQNTKQKQEDKTEVNGQEDVQHVEEDLAINLNNGEKWEVNAAMMPFIKSSENLLANYNKNGENGFKSLASALKNNNNKLISSCTMEGESHDNLHIWLVPHLDLVDKLENAKTNEEAEKVISGLNDSFTSFNKYFR